MMDVLKKISKIRGFSVPVKLQTDLMPLLDDLSQMLKIGSKLLLQTQNGCFKHKCLDLSTKHEESFFVSVNLRKGTCSYIGSDLGLEWVESKATILNEFFNFCEGELKKKKENALTSNQQVESCKVQSQKESCGPDQQLTAGLKVKVEKEDHGHSPKVEKVDEKHDELSPEKVSENDKLSPDLKLTETENAPEIVSKTENKEDNSSPQKVSERDNENNNSISPQKVSPAAVGRKSVTKVKRSERLKVKLKDAENQSTPENLLVPKLENDQMSDQSKLSLDKKTDTCTSISSPKKEVRIVDTGSGQSGSLVPSGDDDKVMNEGQIIQEPVQEEKVDDNGSINKSPHVEKVKDNEANQGNDENNEIQVADKDTNEEEKDNSVKIVAGNNQKINKGKRKRSARSCYVKLERLDKFMTSAMEDDPTLNRSEVKANSEADDKNSIVNQSHQFNHESMEMNKEVDDKFDDDYTIEPNETDENLEMSDVSFKDDKLSQSVKSPKRKKRKQNEKPRRKNLKIEPNEMDEDYKMSDDYSEDGFEDDKPSKSSKNPKRKTRTKENEKLVSNVLDMEMLISNYINNMKSRAKRNKLRKNAHIPCPRCNLSFSSQKGLKKHQNVCQLIKCPRCDKPCTSLTELEEHAKQHVGEEMYKCRFCDELFLMLYSLKRHETSHKEIKLQCPLCPKSFMARNVLRHHLRANHKESRSCCPDCGLLFSDEKEFNKHMSTHDSRRRIATYPCKKCGRAFEMLVYLKRHNRLYHKKKNERLCKHCLDFFDVAVFQDHLDTHTFDKPNTCADCKESFDTKPMLDEHVFKVHRQGSLLYCEICGFQAANSVALKHHKYTHEDTMPYNCEKCGIGFPLKRNYTEHMINHSDELPFVCEVCGKKFKRSSSLASHKMMHSEGIQCRYCTRVFKSHSGLNYHVIRVHSDKVNIENYKKVLYKCDECGLCYPTRILCEQHMTKHLNYKPYECHVERCMKRFKTKQMLESHLEFSHATDITDKKHKCISCGLAFPNKTRLDLHLESDIHRKKLLKGGSSHVTRPSHVTRTETQLKLPDGHSSFIVVNADPQVGTSNDGPPTILIIGDDNPDQEVQYHVGEDGTQYVKIGDQLIPVQDQEIQPKQNVTTHE